jgi:ribosomal protein L37E
MVAKIPEIVSYWIDKKDDSSLGMDWTDAHERCWRCGYSSRLERCHIVPKSLGGSDDPSNLILMCKRCHKEAPNVKDKNFMWTWIENDHGKMYDTYWTLRAFVEFEKIFGRKPFSGQKFKKVKNLSRVIQTEMQDNAIVHYGESGFNISTLVSLIKLVEDKFILAQ